RSLTERGHSAEADDDPQADGPGGEVEVRCKPIQAHVEGKQREEGRKRDCDDPDRGRAGPGRSGIARRFDHGVSGLGERRRTGHHVSLRAAPLSAASARTATNTSTNAMGRTSWYAGPS